MEILEGKEKKSFVSLVSGVYLFDYKKKGKFHGHFFIHCLQWYRDESIQAIFFFLFAPISSQIKNVRFFSSQCLEFHILVAEHKLAQASTNRQHTHQPSSQPANTASIFMIIFYTTTITNSP